MEVVPYRKESVVLVCVPNVLPGFNLVTLSFLFFNFKKAMLAFLHTLSTHQES